MIIKKEKMKLNGKENHSRKKMISKKEKIQIEQKS